jgi:sigma-B regulation protein RsbU (phosphoserine phosphatase)
MSDSLPSRFSLLLEAIGRVNSRLGLDEVLGQIMDAAKVIMDAEASSLIMLDAKTRELIITLPTGPARAEISGARIPPGKGFAGWVATRGEPLVVEDAPSDPRFFGEVARGGFTTKSLICVPMRDSEGQVMGVIQALNRRDGKPFDQSDIPLFAAFADQAAIAIEKSRYYQAALEKERLEQQLSLARDIQTGFWPKEIPAYDRVTIAGRSRPASQVGGDYYDVAPIDDDHCALIVADVSGKGIPAGLIMAATRGALRAQMEGHASMGQIITAINRMLVRDTPMEKYITLFWAVLDVKTLELTYTNAGHNAPLLIDPESGQAEELSEGGPVLGLLPAVAFSPGHRMMRRGGLLVMFTDGIIEAQNPAEEMYGMERLRSRIAATPADCDAAGVLELIDRDVTAFSAGAPQYDDATLLVVKVGTDN